MNFSVIPAIIAWLLCHGAEAQPAVGVHFGSTTGSKCYSVCEQSGKSYYWCWTRTSWEKCSPTSGVTVYGERCKDHCRMNKAKYFFCNKVSGSWNYCSKVKYDDSVQLHYASDGKLCLSPCENRGESYWWCYTRSGSGDWSYCGHKRNGNDVSSTGAPCIGKCSASGKAYTWCRVNNDYFSYWRYCSIILNVRDSSITLNSRKPCMSLCRKQNIATSTTCECHTNQADSLQVCDPNEVVSSSVAYSASGYICLDKCKKHCNTNSKCWYLCWHVKGTDYCSVTTGQTTLGRVCESSSPCAQRGKTYQWCRTTTGRWDYCSIVPFTCTKRNMLLRRLKRKTKKQKANEKAKKDKCSRQDQSADRCVTSNDQNVDRCVISNENGISIELAVQNRTKKTSNIVLPGVSKEHEDAHKVINSLTSLPPVLVAGTIESNGTMRLDNQGNARRRDHQGIQRPHYNLQVQINEGAPSYNRYRNSPGGRTTVANVLVPASGSVWDNLTIEHIRNALLQSLQTGVGYIFIQQSRRRSRRDTTFGRARNPASAWYWYNVYNITGRAGKLKPIRG